MRSFRPLLILWLTLVWVALWGDATLANLAAGLLVAVLLTFVLPATGDRGRTTVERATIRPLAALRFTAWFAWKLVEANVVVAWEVLTPRNRINEGVVAVPLHGDHDGLTALVASCVSLTPGTLVIDLERDPLVLYVHVLHLRTIEEVRAEVQTLEHLAIRAFGSAAARASIAGDEHEARGLPLSSTTTAARRGDGR